MNMLVINNCDSEINIDNFITGLQPSNNTIISENNYYYLLQTSEYFTNLINNKFIVCVPIQDNKITNIINNTIIDNDNTTNTDNIPVVDAIKSKDIEKDSIIETTESETTDNVEKLKSDSEVTNVKSGKRGRKTKLVENDTDNLNKE